MGRAATKALTAKDVMHKRVVTIAPETSLREAMQMFLEENITGAPVVDDDEKLLGVVSQTDLVRYQRRAGPEAAPPGYFRESDGELLVGRLQTELPRTAQVQDIMTPAAFTTDESTPIREIARFMLRRRVHRVIVTRQGKLAGIVTSMDLLRALVGKRA